MYEIRIIQKHSEDWTYEIYLIQSNDGRILTKRSQVKFESSWLALRSAMIIIDCFTHIDHLDAYKQSQIFHIQE